MEKAVVSFIRKIKFDYEAFGQYNDIVEFKDTFFFFFFSFFEKQNLRTPCN